MTTPNVGPGRSDSPPQPFQYSLASLLVVTVVFAIACSIFFSLPLWVAGLATLFLIVSTPMVLTVILIYGRGPARTFSIGALFPAGVCLIPFLPLYGVEMFGRMVSGFSRSGDERLGLPIFVVVYYLFVVGDGLLAVFVRWLLDAPRRRTVRESHAAEDTWQTSDMDIDAREPTDEGP